ncbi:MAG TPA: DUF4173 domain-containing protein [Anaerolineales bacterium]|jgi:hypothetical protein|nr:DUF4173 domain-containing protein [Anaerolineales bacterium]
MKKNPNILWITTIALGWLFDFLFWQKPFGINFAIFTALCLIGGFFVLWKDEKRAARGTLWLIPLVLFFAAVTFVRAEPMTVFLGAVFTLFLMSLIAVTFLGGRWLWYSLGDYVGGFLKLTASMLVRPLSFNAEVKREQDESGVPAKRINLWPILRGIVIALPVVAIFAALLASADVIFGNQLDAFVKLFNLENLPQYIFRLVYILVGAYVLAGTFLHAASQSKDEKLIGEDKPLTGSFLGFTESAIVLGSVTVLFTAFVIVQFRYFFGGQSNINIAGYTYAEYARRGFGELVTVAIFSLLMILGLGAVTRRENEVQRRAFSSLSIAIVALVAVMLVSAYQRLTLYEIAYGFSRLRTYTHVALIWIGLLLGAVVVLEILRRERHFAAAMLIASLGFAISLSVLNVDDFIVNQNIQRELRGQGDNQANSGRFSLDAQYFLDLSDDAISAMARAYQSPTMPDQIKDEIGAALACIRETRDNHADQPWQGFHFSRSHADQIFASLKTELDQYVYSNSEWPYRVISPDGKSYSCSSGYSD